MPTLSIATSIVKKLQDAGFIAYFAGGFVRDFLMQRPSDDIDIATSASVEEVQALFPKTVPVGVAFGIIIVVQEGHQFEVATFRKDHGYVDGRRPTGIERATPEEDATRRDFTINGMFYDPLKKVILDYVEGQKDIEKKIIRAIGNPHERFLEDRLRMMRAIRYSTRFDFPIEPDTIKAILAHANSLLPAVAMERVWQEFKKMAKFAHFDTGLVILHQLKLLPTIFKDLEGVSLEEIEKRVKPIPSFPKGVPPIAELLELFPNYSGEQVEKFCDYLKFSKEERLFGIFLQHAKTLLAMPSVWLNKLENIEWAKFYAHPHSDLCLQIIAVRLENKETFLEEHLKRKHLLQKAILRIEQKKPLVSAADLAKEGIKAGKEMGLLLKEAERMAVNEAIEEKDQIIETLKKSPLWTP